MKFFHNILFSLLLRRETRRLLCYGIEYLLDGTVDKGVLERLQIDACCAFCGVTNRFADGCHRHVLTLGDACPRVACHVGGEFGGKPQLFAQLFQMMVDEVDLVLVLPRLVLSGTCDDGNQVGGTFVFVFINQPLHTGFPTDSDALTWLLSSIGEEIALQVAFLQVGNVGQRHAAGIEAEQEDVTGKRNGGV